MYITTTILYRHCPNELTSKHLFRIWSNYIHKEWLVAGCGAAASGSCAACLKCDITLWAASPVPLPPRLMICSITPESSFDVDGDAVARGETSGEVRANVAIAVAVAVAGLSLKAAAANADAGASAGVSAGASGMMMVSAP